MPVKFALTCAQCNAPLPAVTEPRGTFQCAHCGATTCFALNATEFAYFTEGIRAEQQQEGAFTVSGLERTLADALNGLTESVDRSVRLTERLHRPQLEQALREQRTLLADLLKGLDALKVRVNAQRDKARRNRFYWYVLATVFAIVALFPNGAGYFALAALLAGWGWIRCALRLKTLAQEEAKLLAPGMASVDELRASIAECEQLLAEMESHHPAPTRPPSPPRPA